MYGSVIAIAPSRLLFARLLTYSTRVAHAGPHRPQQQQAADAAAAEASQQYALETPQRHGSGATPLLINPSPMSVAEDGVPAGVECEMCGFLVETIAHVGGGGWRASGCGVRSVIEGGGEGKCSGIGAASGGFRVWGRIDVKLT